MIRPTARGNDDEGPLPNPHGLTRRALLAKGAMAGAILYGLTAAPGCSSQSPSAGEPAAAAPRQPLRPHPAAEEWKARVGVAQGVNDAARNVRTAIEKLCGPDGARTFIRPGDVVVVKPNIGWGETPDAAATTSPEVVAAAVQLCLEAGAARVRVLDNTITDAATCYDTTGIAAAARQAGAEVVFCDPARFRTVAFDDPRVRALKEWPLAEDILAADILVNVAIAKVHPLTRLSLCMKNLMGVQGGDRGKMHAAINQALSDLAVMVRPTLNILDATHILVAGMPGGGRRENVTAGGLVVCGTSAVTVDAWAADPSNLPWPKGHHAVSELGWLTAGAAAGLGVADPAKIEVMA
jgi:uncharacterized protein (DUF362 family)